MAEMFELIQASAHSLPMLADKSIHSVVTSPPFYGLRKYQGEQDIEWPTVEYAPMPGLPALRVQGCEAGCAHEWVSDAPFEPRKASETKSEKQKSNRGTAMGDDEFAPRRYCTKCGGWKGGLGLEPDPVAYIAHLILCLREWRRVLRDDGTCWVNLAPSYAGSWGNYGAREGNQRSRIAERWHRPAYEDDREGWTGLPPTANVSGLKPKDMIMTPFMFALAAQADGWFCRSDIIWAKPNPMPESVTDRPTKSHEYIFLLAKSERYFYDAEAITEPSMHPGITHRVANPGKAHTENAHLETRPKVDWTTGMGRNRRTVWTVATSPFSGAHFATFPPALVEPMVLASTSARGVCPNCGAPWRRVVERERTLEDGRRIPGLGVTHDRQIRNYVSGGDGTNSSLHHIVASETVGWQPSCQCDAGDAIPAVVLDPFAGSGTTLRVANIHGRRAIGIDLSTEYLEQLAPDRLELQPYLTGADMGAGG